MSVGQLCAWGEIRDRQTRCPTRWTRQIGREGPGCKVAMTREFSVEELWDAPESGKCLSRSDRVSALPESARRYLEHAVAPGTPLAAAVRLQMHGEIKLRRWFPFEAEQVIRRDRGMIWSATVRMCGIPVRGSDRFLDGEGSMRWRLLGIVPLVMASGPDITRSAVGRLAAESVWLPPILLGDGVTWKAPGLSTVEARLALQGHTVALTLTVSDDGRLQSVALKRWGNPGDGEFRLRDFGGTVEDEGTFGGYTIPTRLRVGWGFEAGRFGSDGEFFRVTVDEATYRE